MVAAAKRRSRCHVCLICVENFATCAELKRHYADHINGLLDDCADCTEDLDDTTEVDVDGLSEPDSVTFEEPAPKALPEVLWLDDFEEDARPKKKEDKIRPGPKSVTRKGRKTFGPLSKKLKAVKQNPTAMKREKIVTETDFMLDKGKTNGQSASVPKDVKKEIHDADTANKPKQTRDWSCDECEFEAPRRNLLSRHVNKVHKGMKYLPCQSPGCSYEAQNGKHLGEHVKNSHEKIRDIECSHCDFKTGRRKSLMVHLKNIHSEREVRKRLRYKPCPIEGCSYQAKTTSHLWEHAKNRHEGSRTSSARTVTTKPAGGAI